MMVEALLRHPAASPEPGVADPGWTAGPSLHYAAPAPPLLREQMPLCVPTPPPLRLPFAHPLRPPTGLITIGWTECGTWMCGAPSRRLRDRRTSSLDL
jgi:hypothetical protein